MGSLARCWSSCPAVDFALRFVDGKGLLGLRERRHFALVGVERLELEIPHLRFPFDVSGGAERFQTRRCVLSSAELHVDEARLQQWLAARTQLARFGVLHPRVRLQTGRVEVFDFATGRAETLIERADRLAVAGDHITTIVRDGKRLRAIAANRPPESLRTPAAAGEAPSRKTGWIDLARIRLAVEPPQEWRQMLREVWRLLRDQFWVADMS